MIEKGDFIQMEKIKEYITSNKKTVILVVIVLVLLITGGIWFAVQSSIQKDEEPKQREQIEQKQKKIEKEVKLDDIKPLIDKGVIKGMKDYEKEKGSKVDLKKLVIVDDSIVQKMEIDDSKVDSSKEGKYEVIYTITLKGDDLNAFLKKNKDIKLSFDTNADEIILKVKTTVSIKNKKQAKEEPKQSNKDNETKEAVTNNNQQQVVENKPNTENYTDQSSSSSKPNGGNVCSSNNKPNNDNSISNSDNSNTNTKPKEPVHEHQYDIYVPEKSHTEEREVPIIVHQAQYEIVDDWYECNKCHARFDIEHDCFIHCGDVCGCGWSYQTEREYTGLKEVTRYEMQNVKVVDEEAYYMCSCGARL